MTSIDESIDDILDALSEKKVGREELEKHLKRFLEYGVPLDHAKETLIKKFGGSRVLIKDLKPDQRNITLICRVININQREITVRGETRKIFYGILGDESGTVPFTAWKDFEIEKGDVVEISNACAREWGGNIKLSLGERTTIKITDEALPEAQPTECKVKDLRPGLGAIEIVARILKMEERQVEVGDQRKNVYSGVLGDETGKAQFTSWHDFELKEGDVIKISGGYIKSWKGIPQLIFDEKATVERLDSSVISEKSIKTQRLPLHELVEKRGALDVEVEGTVIDIRKGSGLIDRCPECNRVLREGKCSIHGDVEGITDLRIKLVMDDGTGAVGGILGREVTEKLLGKSFEELKTEKSYDKIIEKMNNLLFSQRLVLQGNALGDEFGTTIIARDAKIVDIDVEAESRKLFEELEEL